MIEGKLLKSSRSKEDMFEQIFCFSGKTVGVNKWKAPRSIKDHGKWKAMMYKTPEYRNFVTFLAGTFAQGRAFGKELVDVNIRQFLSKRMDSDALEKPLLDAMEASGLVDNDKQVRDVIKIRGYRYENEQDFLIISVRQGKKRKMMLSEVIDDLLGPLSDPQASSSDDPSPDPVDASAPAPRKTAELF